MLTAGQKAPDFTLAAADGNTVTLSSFIGKKVVLYFYPKDNTPGCTKEACSFRDNIGIFRIKGAVVLGVSPDSEKSHKGFAEKHSLPFTLLSDNEHKVAEMYGAWGEKTNYGKKYFGIIRSTFIIDENGVILKVYPKVKPEKHAEEILEIL